MFSGRRAFRCGYWSFGVFLRVELNGKWGFGGAFLGLEWSRSSTLRAGVLVNVCNPRMASLVSFELRMFSGRRAFLLWILFFGSF